MNKNRELAEIWNKNIDKEEANKRANRILQQINEYLPNAKKVLELGVGIGYVLLAFRNFECSGLDLSKEHIRIAKRVIPKAKLFVKSMHNFKIPEKFDVIFTTNEGINEVQPYKRWKLTFEQVYKHLEDKGLFILDMPTRLYLKDQQNTITKLEKTPSGYIYDKTIVKGNKLTWDTVFFKKLSGEKYKLITDNYDEFIYPLNKVKKDLNRRFTILKVILFDKKETVMIVCRKRGK
jgi:cyclopropane fatty-acyl-phospholipid synthase-like methyltransferase